MRSSFESGKPDLAWKVLEQLGDLSKTMKDTADGLTNIMMDLVQLSEDALAAAQTDMCKTAEEKTQLEKLLGETKASRAALEESVQEYGRLIAEVKEEEAKHAKTANKERD